MVRWYDYVLSTLTVVFIVNAIVAGFLITTWWGLLLGCLLAFIVWEAWDKHYTAFRIKQERRIRIKNIGL
jgi:hypothetical protein